MSITAALARPTTGKLLTEVITPTMLDGWGVVFDYETSSRGPDGSPEAYYEDNFSIMMQYGDTLVTGNMEAGAVALFDKLVNLMPVSSNPLASAVYLIGHNVGFDFRWWMRDLPVEHRKAVLDWITYRKLLLVDTQDMMYLASGHQYKQQSLEEVAVRTVSAYKKSSYLSDLFKEGKTAEDADPQLLAEYLDADIKATHAAAQHLSNYMLTRGMQGLLYRACCAKTMAVLAEYTGLPFNPDSAYEEAEGIIKQLDVLEEQIAKDLDSVFLTYPSNLADNQLMHNHLTPEQIKKWQNEQLREAMDSPKRLATILHGITSKTPCSIGKLKVQVCAGNYKNGKPKFKSTVLEPKAQVEGLCNEYAFVYGTDEIIASADEPSLSKFIENCDKMLLVAGDEFANAIKRLLQVRLLSKQINTYYLPLIRATSNSMDGRVHHKLNTNITGTGRLSSSNPNAQNMPGTDKSNLKKHFKEAGWRYVEGDFKQVEVVGLAARTRCEKLRQVLVAGGDMHYNSGKVVFGWTDPSQMGKVEKRIVKGVNFGLIYGGSPAGLAKQTGVAEATCKALADAFYSSYPGVKAFQDCIVRAAAADAKTTPDRCPDTGMPRLGYTYNCPYTRRAYRFKSYAGNVWHKGKKTVGQRMSPTELKNYTVQGFATADFVPYAMYYCVTNLARSYDYGVEFKFINTVHDSIQFQIAGTVDADQFAADLARFMSESWIDFLRVTGRDIDPFLVSLPMKGEIDVGPSWGEMETVVLDKK